MEEPHQAGVVSPLTALETSLERDLAHLLAPSSSSYRSASSTTQNYLLMHSPSPLSTPDGSVHHVPSDDAPAHNSSIASQTTSANIPVTTSTIPEPPHPASSYVASLENELDLWKQAYADLQEKSNDRMQRLISEYAQREHSIVEEMADRLQSEHEKRMAAENAWMVSLEQLVACFRAGFEVSQSARDYVSQLARTLEAKFASADGRFSEMVQCFVLVLKHVERAWIKESSSAASSALSLSPVYVPKVCAACEARREQTEAQREHADSLARLVQTQEAQIAALRKEIEDSMRREQDAQRENLVLRQSVDQMERVVQVLERSQQQQQQQTIEQELQRAIQQSLLLQTQQAQQPQQQPQEPQQPQQPQSLDSQSQPAPGGELQSSSTFVASRTSPREGNGTSRSPAQSKKQTARRSKHVTPEESSASDSSAAEEDDHEHEAAEHEIDREEEQGYRHDSRTQEREEEDREEARKEMRRRLEGKMEAVGSLWSKHAQLEESMQRALIHLIEKRENKHERLRGEQKAECDRAIGRLVAEIEEVQCKCNVLEEKYAVLKQDYLACLPAPRTKSDEKRSKAKSSASAKSKASSVPPVSPLKERYRAVLASRLALHPHETLGPWHVSPQRPATASSATTGGGKKKRAVSASKRPFK